MPPYNFPSSEELLRQLFGNYQSQQSEPRSATEIANEATVAGLQQKINEQQQAQAQQQALDPIARKYYVPQLLDSKKLYESANNPAVQSQLGMNQEQIQQQAHNTADRWRQAASGAGFDLSGYGSDVSLQDAYQNLQTNDARAVVDLAQGEYALTSDQYFTRRYDELRREGYGHFDAKNRAGAAARQYQGKRVSYLSGMLDGYGFDGRVMTPLGQQIVAQLASEKPEIANMYLNANPGQKEAFAADNQRAQSVLQNQGAMDRLMQQHRNGFEDRADAYNYNTMGAYRDSDIRQDEAWNAAERDFAARQRQFSQDRVNKEQSLRDKFALDYEMGAKIGYKGKELDNFVAITNGYPVAQAQKFDFKPLQEFFKQESENYNKALASLGHVQGDEREVVVSRLKNLDKELNVMRSKFGQYLNIEQEDFMPDAYEPNNEIKNINTVKQILKFCVENNATDQQVKDTLREWAPNISDEELLRLMQRAGTQSQ